MRPFLTHSSIWDITPLRFHLIMGIERKTSFYLEVFQPISCKNSTSSRLTKEVKDSKESLALMAITFSTSPKAILNKRRINLVLISL